MLYDILRSVRRVYDFTAVAFFFQDIVYALISALVTFLFLLGVTNGELRLFVFVGLTLGFLLSRLTISKVLVLSLKWIIANIDFIFNLISRQFYRYFELFELNILKIFKKTLKRAKKLLKTVYKLLYTKKDKTI